jgi:hypothetical protein
MKNPFEYGGVVGGAAFCNRESETRDIIRAIENADKLFIFSERRYGKTSLVRAALAKVPRKGHLSAYVDLWPTDDEASFVTAVAKAITESMSGSAQKLLETAKRLFASLSPSVTLDEEGKPSLNFGLDKQAKIEPVFDEVLKTPAHLAANENVRVTIVFDEFQQILEYASDRVERKLRSVIQNQRNVGYLFLGSRKHLIERMVLDESRPLYRAGGHYPLGTISEQDWQPFIRKHFAEWNKRISDDHIHEICESCQGHPFYTQHLCHLLWEMCDPKREVTHAMLRGAVKILLDRESYAYTTLWESLTLSQRRFLKGLAAEPAKTKVYSSEFLGRYGVGSASNAQRAVESLLAKDVIDRDESYFLISDRFFRLWIKTA